MSPHAAVRDTLRKSSADAAAGRCLLRLLHLAVISHGASNGRQHCAARWPSTVTLLQPPPTKRSRNAFVRIIEYTSCQIQLTSCPIEMRVWQRQRYNWYCWRQITNNHFILPAYFNPLQCKCNYDATSNNMTLVHWPLMGGLLHLVQRGGDWAGPQITRPSFLYQMWQPTNQRPVYQSHNCCIMFRCSAVLMCPLKGEKAAALFSTLSLRLKYFDIALSYCWIYSVIQSLSLPQHWYIITNIISLFVKYSLVPAT